MCGIAGIADSVPLDRDEALESVNRMVEALHHRGPDDRGTSIGPKTALGHARLAIIDLSAAGRQPMALPGGEIELTFNGEIYNFRDLRRRLESRGCEFSSATDSEVLLHGYRCWGIHGLLERIEGMFAFAIRDGNSLWLVRDPFGIKPLYYRHTEGRLEFASEMKALEVVADSPAPVDTESLLLALHHFAVPAPRAIRRGYAQLEPGHLMHFDLDTGELKNESYWRWEIAPEEMDEDRAVEAVWESICASVERHLVADVDVGVFLSGGLDSSLIAAACSEIGRRTPCLTIAMQGEKESEAPYAEALCRHYGLSHQVETMTADLGLQLDRELLETFDEPFNGSAALSAAWICRVARRHYKVMLSGDGGDELFGGYKWYWKWCRFYGETGEDRFSLNEAWRRFRGKRYMPRDPLRGFARLLGTFTPEVMNGLFDPEVLDAHPLGASPEAWYRGIDRPELKGFDRLQWMDMHMFLPNVCLPKMDRTSMAESLEVRVPFLDRSLATLVGRIPSEIRNPGFELKGLLRKVAASRLPEALLSKRKKGFSPPMRRWFDDRAFRSEISRDIREGGWWRGIFAPSVEHGVHNLRGRSLWRFLQVWRYVRSRHVH